MTDFFWYYWRRARSAALSRYLRLRWLARWYLFRSRRMVVYAGDNRTRALIENDSTLSLERQMPVVSPHGALVFRVERLLP